MQEKESGFSIIEVIVALCLVLVVFALCIIEFGALQTSQKQRYEDVAYQVANKQMEALRATAFASLPASGTISDTSLSQIPSGAGSFTAASYSGYSGMKEIVVTVTWNDGSSKSVVLRTLAQSGGINP